MNNAVFTPDCPVTKTMPLIDGAPIPSPAAVITDQASEEAVRKGDAFAQEIAQRYVSDFEKEGDRMVHVSTFVVVDDTIYMSYYANIKEPEEEPTSQTARLAYCKLDDLDNKVILDMQAAGDLFDGKPVERVYDTILMQKDEDTLYIMWTAQIGDNYYRFYRPFTMSTKTLGETGVHRFKVDNIINDFSQTGMQSALVEAGKGYKTMYADIGIMQKLSSQVENGETYYYSGAYSGDFTCIIKSRDLITWEYVSQPDFLNHSKWENATYVLDNKVYYFVRQWDTDKASFLTVYDIATDAWAPPVEIYDTQSRGDFILYQGQLYLFHAPIDREHIGIVKINTEDITKSEVVLQANMQGSCFYPFVNYFRDGELAMSYTISRQHIRLAEFTLSKYL